MEGQSNKSNGLLSSLSCNIGWGLTVLLSNISHQHLIYGCKSHTQHTKEKGKKLTWVGLIGSKYIFVESN